MTENIKIKGQKKCSHGDQINRYQKYIGKKIDSVNDLLKHEDLCDMQPYHFHIILGDNLDTTSIKNKIKFLI
jgi:hypothetical protein